MQQYFDLLNLKEYWDYTSTLETAERKGEKKKAIEIAKRLKSQGMSDTDISSLTGLGIDEVTEL